MSFEIFAIIAGCALIGFGVVWNVMSRSNSSPKPQISPKLFAPSYKVDLSKEQMPSIAGVTIEPMGAKIFTQAHADKAKGDKRHCLIAIGFLGAMRCYLDLSYAEARERFAAEFNVGGDANLDEYSVIAFGFDDSFTADEVRPVGG